MPRLLRAAETHSRSLGYRWNPAKCVVLNPPNAHGARPLKLYGTEIPSSNSFTLAAMRNTLQVLGLRTSSFSRLTSSRLYATFVRPCFEYGLCLCLFTVKELELLEKGQDFCLRIAFGGHKTTSTAVFKHITNLPSMTERAHILGFKFIVCAYHLESDSLLGSLLSFLETAPKSKRFRWPILTRVNPIWTKE
ncbi:hypothetical protein G6F57_011360 [Rhizopus arrhizus]|nr:hypothetical protein G6F63_009090 [Rhizopus arrhizus]KAG1414008.1 hypothetical protein G6F59_010458 [Rhizopus arrhizus]KAG1471510.1 hypothetical protein G6F57_011360 [Rhizopus arrhizus]